MEFLFHGGRGGGGVDVFKQIPFFVSFYNETSYFNQRYLSLFYNDF